MYTRGYYVTIHATIDEFMDFMDNDHQIKVNSYVISPYILQDGRRIFVCDITHQPIDPGIPEYKVFESINSLRQYINRFKTSTLC